MGNWNFGAPGCWSVAGPSNRPNVSQLLLRHIKNYNMAEGWYLVSSPIITANWEASSGNKWACCPLGAGIGKIFTIGERPDVDPLAAGFRLPTFSDWWTAMGGSAPNCNSFFHDSAAAVRDMPFVGEN